MSAAAVLTVPPPTMADRPFTLTAKQIEGNRLLGSAALNVLLRGGSRSGKTFLLVRAVIRRALKAAGSRHCIWRFHYNHAVASIGLDTFPKVIAKCFPDLVGVKFNHVGIAVLPNGSEIWLGGLDDKERVEKILGLEFATNYFNEASHIPYGSIEIATSRLAQRVLIDDPSDPRCGDLLPLRNYFDMNPPGKRHWSYDLFVRKIIPGSREPLANPEDYVEMQMNPDDNRENLPDQYFKVLDAMSAAKRKRFREGEWANDAEGALWTSDMLDAARGEMPARDMLARVVIGVDPSGSKGVLNKSPKFVAGETKPNDIGIVVAGIDRTGMAWVLEDLTVNLPPGQWASVVSQAYHRWDADRVVAEQNFGGAMVESVLQTADPLMAIKMVQSSRGKALRAEPIAALYEANQRRVKHVGYLGELEDQMAMILPQPIGYTGEGSPDRLDAAVFALTELMLGDTYNLDNL